MGANGAPRDRALLWQAGRVPPANASAPPARGRFAGAASRGCRTALVERHDFASGTSSKSSKMVHGGLRSLQQRDFRLVYEALHERQRLLENAPHLVAPL